MATEGSTIDDTQDLMALADRFATVYATYREAEEIFAPQALFDINVPGWRFQVEGPDAFFSWLRGHSPDGYGIRIVRATPTASGFVVEVEGEYTPHGHELYFRNLIRCEVRDGRINEVVYYCTGDWDPDTRARWLDEPPIVNREAR
jgi:hypothetical protein